MEEIKREVIKKHLEGWENDLRKPSIEYFVKKGKVNGSFFMALKDMLDDYVEQLRIHNAVAVEQSDQLVCDHSKHTFFRVLHKTRKCNGCGGIYEAKACHHKWISDEKDLRDRYEVMQDYAEKYHKEQLSKHDVVRQSEQFISLIRELIDVGIINEDDIEVENWVNNYLKEIN